MRFIIILGLYLISFSNYAQKITVHSDTVCFGNTTTLIATSESSNVSYYWDLDFDGYYNDAIGDTIAHLFSQQTNQFIKVKAIFTDSQTEVSEDNIEIKFHNVPSTNFNLIGNCENEEIKFANNSLISDNSTLQYKWNIEPEINVEPSLLFNSEPAISFESPGEYSIGLTVTSEYNCISSLTKEHSVYSLPDFEISNSNEACEQDTIEFILSEGSIPLLNVIWKFGDGTQSITNNTEQHIYTEGGIYQATATGISENNCRSVYTTTLLINELPKFEFVFDDTTNLYEGVAINLSTNNVFNEYFWQDASSSSSIEVTQSGVYSLKVKNESGCEWSDSLSFNFKQKNPLTIESEILTPNGDGFNDLFVVKDVNIYENCSVQIINSQGKIVLNSNHYNNDWDGKHNGKLLAPGAYYYLVKADNEEQTGSIQILH